MSNYKNQIAGGVILRGDKILIACRKQGDEDEFLWEFPGGKIEEGETPEIALERELKEELGLEVEVKDKICELDMGGRKFFFYFAVPKNDIDRLECHQEIKWVELRELAEFKFCEPDRKVLPTIICYLKEVRIW